MLLNKIYIIALSLLFLIPEKTETIPINTRLAEQYFQEFQSICNRDNGKLWGISLYGPMLIADPKTHFVVANECDKNDKLKPSGNLFMGKLPVKEGIANSFTRWSGKLWTMVMWPLYEDKYERARLMIHESFHRIQDEIGFPHFNSSSDHLDTYEGRIWLQLEFRALIKALSSKGDERYHAIKDALVFRTHRRNLFTNAASLESRLEMNEGLAEYTGIKLCGIPDSELCSYVVKKFELMKGWKTFIRTFPYLSGPAYCILLDESGTSWRRNLKPSDDLGKLIQKAYSIKIPEALKLEAESRSHNYDFETLQKLEIKHKQELERLTVKYQERFIEGPVLIIPTHMAEGFFNITFKPDNLHPLGNQGIVYDTMRASSSWGILNVFDGALLTPSWEKVYVPAPIDSNTRPLSGEGWELTLNENWTLVSAVRKGDFILEKVEK